jgi:hypothetical protein
MWYHFAFRAFALGTSPPPTSTPSAFAPKTSLLQYCVQVPTGRSACTFRAHSLAIYKCFVDHRRAIASNILDCAPPTNLVSALVPLLPCIASERCSSRTFSVSYCVAALRVDVVPPRFYGGDFTCAVCLLVCLYSFRAYRRSPLSSQIRLYFF